MREKRQFVTLHYVDDAYHKTHPQMVHRHNDVLELLYIMEGGGGYVVGGHEYYVQPGNLIICNAGVFHGEQPGQMKSMVSYCCVMDHVLQPGWARNTISGKADHPVLFFSDERQELENIFYALFDLHRKSSEYRMACERLAQAILEIVLEKLRIRNQLNEETQQNNNKLIQDVSAFLDDHFTEDLTLEDLETRFHISRFALGHVFKEETGISPMKYVMMRRIGESQNLLMNTDLPIGDIGEQLGFNDNSHFSNAFKKYIGTTPGAYRKHFKAAGK